MDFILHLVGAAQNELDSADQHVCFNMNNAEKQISKMTTI